MNQNLDEQKIRQLFRDARQADEHTAPPFAATLAAAMTKAERRAPRLPFVRIAIAAVALMVISVSAFVIFKQSAASSKSDPVAQARYVVRPWGLDPARRLDRSPEVTPIPVPAPVLYRPAIHHRSQMTPRRRSLAPSTTLISQWQSPTDFLLTIPGGQLLKTVPRLRDSSITFKTTLPDEKN